MTIHINDNANLVTILVTRPISLKQIDDMVALAEAAGYNVITRIKRF